MNDAIKALMASRKSLVGIGAMILIGLVLFFGPGTLDDKKSIFVSIAAVAATIIHAIGQEDAASKGSNVTVTNVTARDDQEKSQ